MYLMLSFIERMLWVHNVFSGIPLSWLYVSLGPVDIHYLPMYVFIANVICSTMKFLYNEIVL